MKPRVNYVESGKGAMNAMLAFSGYVTKSGLEHTLINLIDFRVSQINGCAYCLDMHSKDLRAAGESEHSSAGPLHAVPVEPEQGSL